MRSGIVSRLFVVALLMVACAVCLVATPPNRRVNVNEFLEPFTHKFFDFWPVNPPDPSKQGYPYEYYVWMPKHFYQAGERIPFYHEVWYSPNRESIVGRGKGIFQIFYPIPEESVEFGTLSEVGCRLLIRRAPFKKKVIVIFRDYDKVPKYPFNTYFPDPQEIPFHWLHGNPVKYEKSWEPFDVTLNFYPGESFVRYVPNLLDYWYLKKDSRGRIYVKCAVPSLQTRGYHRNHREVWLPIEGRYRMQYRKSNIIEFDIR